MTKQLIIITLLFAGAVSQANVRKLPTLGDFNLNLKGKVECPMRAAALKNDMTNIPRANDSIIRQADARNQASPSGRNAK
jgi:hypothetical protein